MNNFLMPSYHTSVCDALRTLSWVRESRAYPEEKTAFTTPAVFFSIPGWERAESNGALMLDLSLEFYVVCDRVATQMNPEPEIFCRSASLDLSQWLEGNTFGVEGVGPLQFEDCQRDAFDPEMDDYLVFRITATQQITAGVDPYDPGEFPTLKEAWLGRVPDVGRAHIDDYRLIYRAEEESDGRNSS